MFAGFGAAAEDFLADKIVHLFVGLMQPQAAQVRFGEAFVGHVLDDMLADHGQHLFEDLAPVLHELHVPAVGDAVGAGAAEEAVVVSDVV